MTTSTLVVRPDMLSEVKDAGDVWLDWTEAASPAVMRAPRIQPPAYVFRDSTNSHLDGQGCDLVDAENADSGVQTVIFSCGCVDRVPLASLHPR
jgi:hypothetical protein